jgi:hypothetical protein
MIYQGDLGVTKIMSSQIRSTKIVLDRFEEVVGEYGGSEIKDGRVIAVLNGSLSMVLPGSASAVLRRVEVGQCVAIMRLDDTVKVRRL